VGRDVRWDYLDRPSSTADWPAQPSLTVDLQPGSAPHSLFWFIEGLCVDRDGRYCIEGTIEFEGLEVTWADGEAESIEQFFAEARRFWDVLYGLNGQPRRVQRRQADVPAWRRPVPCRAA
jgi:hypothetical protein